MMGNEPVNGEPYCNRKCYQGRSKKKWDLLKKNKVMSAIKAILILLPDGYKLNEYDAFFEASAGHSHIKFFRIYSCSPYNLYKSP